MPRKKRLRFATLRAMDNVVDGRHPEPGWFERAFGPTGLVTLELGCGRGEYTLALARRRPDSGVLGVDRNGARLWKGATRALEEGVANAFFLRAMVEHLEEHVPPGRVGEIWVPFPDPLPKNRQAKHRLVSRPFLERYRRLLCAGGALRLKTDDSTLTAFAERVVHDAGGRLVDRSESVGDGGDSDTSVQTTYEKRFRAEGRTIYERTFRLD